MYSLALELGQPNPYAMMANMPARVYDDWVKFFNHGLPLHRLLDHHLASIQTILLNVYRDRKKHPSSFNIEEYSLFKDKSISPAKSKTDDEKGAELLNNLMFYQQMYDTGVLSDDK